MRRAVQVPATLLPAISTVAPAVHTAGPVLFEVEVYDIHGGVGVASTAAPVQPADPADRDNYQVSLSQGMRGAEGATDVRIRTELLQALRVMPFPFRGFRNESSFAKTDLGTYVWIHPVYPFRPWFLLLSMMANFSIHPWIFSVTWGAQNDPKEAAEGPKLGSPGRRTFQPRIVKPSGDLMLACCRGVSSPCLGIAVPL